ncbi:MAG: hypothetical protein MHM6MM_001468 [Cercozoa sp. M6MM]
MSAKDDLVAQFCNVTGCDSAKSLQFLEMANWSLEGAIELFFSLGGDASAAPQTQQQSETHVPAPRQAQHTQLVEDAFLPRGRPIESYGQQWADPKSNGERNLMAMFAPPDFAFSGTLDEACTLAQNQEKWLLVNLQDGTDFDCHAVNRDLWKDEAIADMMLTQLLLWQCDSESHEAQVFFANYRLPRKFPTLVVLDPITRALMAQLPIDVRNGRIKSKATRSALRKFLREHPDPPSLRPKRPRSTAVAADTTDSTGSSDRHTDHVDEDDEDNTGSIVNLVDDEPAEKKRSRILPPEPEESEPNTCSVRFRMDRAMLQRRFYLSDTVQALYAYVRHELQQAEHAKQNADFILRVPMPPRQVHTSSVSLSSAVTGYVQVPQGDTNLRDARVANAVLVVSFL